MANSLFPVPNDDLFIASEFYDFGNYLLCDINLALDLISEELFNFAQFIRVLYLTYKLSGNRKISIVYASLVTLVIFGVYHFQPDMGGWMRIVSDILIRGLGSIFEFYGY